VVRLALVSSEAWHRKRRVCHPGALHLQMTGIVYSSDDDAGDSSGGDCSFYIDAGNAAVFKSKGVPAPRGLARQSQKRSEHNTDDATVSDQGYMPILLPECRLQESLHSPSDTPD